MKNLLLCLTIFLLFSCNSGTNTVQNSSEASAELGKIKQMDWVIGKWQNLSKDGDLQESWIKTNDSTYSGNAFMIVNKDTVFAETMTLELRRGDLHYIPVTRDQNNSLPVRFTFIPTGNDEITFENKEHDFPQRVIYKNPGSDSLYARIEGDENGKFRKEEFAMKKAK